MAYGSPERLADVPAYYSDIRGGRPIAPEHLDDLVSRYRRLGIEESNPLNAITEAVDAAIAGGAGTLVGLVLAPHYSRLSIAGYEKLLDDAVAGRAQVAFV